MNLKNNYDEDASNFVNALRAIRLESKIQIGSVYLNVSKGVTSSIQHTGLDLLAKFHEYTFELPEGKLELSLQFYENINYHYRLFAYSKFGSFSGMNFSINITTGKESVREIVLSQKIKFTEGVPDDIKDAKEYRRQKANFLGRYLRTIGIKVSTKNDVDLGVFDLKNKNFHGTSAERFLREFIIVALVKGHYQGNKGYQLNFVPIFKYL